MTQITNISDRNIGAILCDYFKECKESIYLISPFIEISALEKILFTAGTNQISIVTTWKLNDLKTGISSLELYPLCQKYGWTLYINNELHAKIYSISFDSCYLGSMNCTNKALFDSSGNIECLFYKDKMDVGNRIELNKIISSSILVDDRIYLQYKNWFDKIEMDPQSSNDLDLGNLSQFYIFQLPTIAHPLDLWNYIQSPQNYSEKEREYYEHDLAIYTSGTMNFASKNEFIKDIQTHFINHPFIKKIDSEITPKGLRFGAYKELVRNLCSDVPLPYMNELTVFVQNLYGWFTELFPDLYFIDVPGSHSQFLHRRRKSIRIMSEFHSDLN